MADTGETDSYKTCKLSYLVITVIAVLSCNVIVAGELAKTTDVKIVEQKKLTGDCLDNTGTKRDDGHSWQSAVGACDSIVCHIEISGNYLIQHTCPEVTANENPDPDNCQQVADSSKTFPGCCPDLQCASSSPLTTMSPTVCSDLSETASCEIWKSKLPNSAGCTPTGPFYDLFLKYFCRKTCNLC